MRLGGAWFLLALSYVSLLVFGLTDNTRGPVFPDILREFSLSQTAGSFFFIMGSGTSIFSGLFAHRVLKWLGDIPTLRLGMALLLVSQALFAWSQNFYFLLLGAFVFGICIGVLGVAQNVLVLHAAPNGESQKWLSGLHSMYGISSLLAPLLVNVCLYFGGTWQTAFVLNLGLTALVLALSFFERQGDEQLPPPEVAPPVKVPGAYWFAGLLGFYVAFELLVCTRLNLFAQSVKGLSVEEANYLMAGFFFFLTAGRVASFFVQLKARLETQLAGYLILGSFVFLAGVWVHPFFMALTGLLLAPIYPLAMSLAGQKFGPQVRAVASLAVSLSGVAVVTMHAVVGLASDFWGLTPAIVLGTGTAWVATFCLWRLKVVGT